MHDLSVCDVVTAKDSNIPNVQLASFNDECEKIQQHTFIRRGSFQIVISWSAKCNFTWQILICLCPCTVLHAMENCSYGRTVVYSCTSFLRQIFNIERVENLLLNKPSMDNFKRIIIILITSLLAFCFRCEPMTMCIIPYKQDPVQHFYVLFFAAAADWRVMIFVSPKKRATDSQRCCGRHRFARYRWWWIMMESQRTLIVNERKQWKRKRVVDDEWWCLICDWRYAADGCSGTMLFCVSFCVACETDLVLPLLPPRRCPRLISLAIALFVVINVDKAIIRSYSEASETTCL